MIVHRHTWHCIATGMRVIMLATSLSLGAAPIWNTWEGEADGWKASPWFGLFHSAGLEPGWAYSTLHGWVWLHGPAEDSMWIWDHDLGWIWTRDAVHPACHQADTGGWLHCAASRPELRWAYDYGDGTWRRTGTGRGAPAQATPLVQVLSIATGAPGVASLTDGTRAELPPQEVAFTVTLGRESNTFSLAADGLATSGSARTLTIDPPAGLDAERVTPLIVLPRAEIGTLDPGTVNIIRIETIPDGAGGTIDRHAFLPVSVRPDGSIAARDYLMPDSIQTVQRQAAQNRAPFGRLAPEDGPAEPATPVRIRYVASTFSGSLNYNRSGQLIRMIPDLTPPYYRIPFDEVDEKIREIEDRKWVQNVIVLVHGHNEEEKGGIYTASAERPWYFAYKRDVWSLFYKSLAEYEMYKGNTERWRLFLEDTTRFYEFVYPSYRGIFNDLDGQLAGQLENALAKQLGAGMPVNVVIIAHSMGGLVARAAIQKFSSALDERFMKLITWGTPHLGSPLVSLRYVLAADIPYDFNTAGSPALATFAQVTGIYNWGDLAEPVLKSLLREIIASIQMDAPGTRDLRYVRRPLTDPTFRLGLDQLFKLSAAQQTPENEQKYDLQQGSAIYNYNLQILNQNDRHRGDDKYFPIYSSTFKRLEIVKTDSFPWRTISNWNVDTARGATAMPLLVADPDEAVYFPQWPGYSLGKAGDSDGAVNVPSMTAFGVSKWVGSMHNTDHEEYFGAPDSAGNYANLSKGTSTANFTSRRMYGGDDDPRYAYDRYGIMDAPNITIEAGIAYGVAYAGYVETYDIGYAERFPLMVYLQFDDMDEQYEAPYANFKQDGLTLVRKATGAETDELVIPVTDPVVNPPELPLFSTGASIVDYAGDPRLLVGMVELTDLDIDNQPLFLRIQANDGTRLEWPVAFKVRHRPYAGTWKMTLYLYNNAGNNAYLNRSLVNFALTFDAQGLATIDDVSVSENSSLAADGTGWWERTEWTWTGDVRIKDNVLTMYVTVDRIMQKYQKAWIYVGSEKKMRTINESSNGMMELAFEGPMTGWPWSNNVTFYSGEEQITKGYAVNYVKTTDVDGVVTETVPEAYEGDVTYSLTFTQPPQ
jgi:hypothetical protein